MIPGLEPTEFAGFVGRTTDENLTEMSPGYLLVAKNVICQGDGTVKTGPGYTLVKELSTASKVVKLFDWQRPSDKKQFTIVQGGGKLRYLTPGADGTYAAAEQVLSANEDDTATFDFVQNYFSLYGNNGKNAYKFVDNAGVLTKYQWGINAPTVAPTVAASAGTLTLAAGRQYCYAFVSYITDAAGNQRMHIGAPSPISAHTGPETSKVITVGGMQVSTDPQVTHKWIFATVDAAFDTSSTFYFVAEVTNGTVSFGDTLTDDQLDTTRLAPFDNHPAPFGSIVLNYQNRAVIIDPVLGLVYFSAFEEVDLGIPQEAFPSSLFFEPPAGTHKPNAGAVVDDGDTLLIGTTDAWTKLTGYNADTFQMKERVVSPGPAGKDCWTRTPTHLVWLSVDKKINAWDTRIGNITGIPATPIEMSQPIQQKLTGVYSMEDLKDSELANAKLAWFSYGRHHYLIAGANTLDQQNSALNWVQLWYVATEQGQIKSVGETDFLPSDLFASMANITVGSTAFIFFGDYANGNIYRWPDGFTHNGQKPVPVAGIAWSNLGTEKKKELKWADVITDRVDSKDSFGAAGVSSGTPNMTLKPTPLENDIVPSPEGIDPMQFRVKMRVPGVSVGSYTRLLFEFPNDGTQSILRKVCIYAREIG